jgi:uncharacterized protein YbjQ (UPF0145 family)
MKNMVRIFLLITATLVLSSCSYIKYIPKSTTVSIIDFRQYTKNGFLFTPYDYKGDYESIGMIHAKLMPEAKIVKVSTGKKDSIGNTIYKDDWDVSKIETHDAMDTLRENATKMGADAVINLEISSTQESFNIGRQYSITLNGIEVEGFAIKRKGAFTEPSPNSTRHIDSIPTASPQ